MVSIPACHAGDRGSIPRRVDGYIYFFLIHFPNLYKKYLAFYSRRVDPTLAAFIVGGPLQFMLLIEKGDYFIFLFSLNSLLSLSFSL